jgi:two-component system, sensor histidine kinase RegB
VLGSRSAFDGSLLSARIGQSRLRLQTIVRLRWVAVLAQLSAVGLVYLGLGFPMPVGYCLSFIALSAWLNVYLSIRYPARYRLGVVFATLMLAYDIAQLAALLYLTGGVENPFTVLLVAPVTVSAATLPLVSTLVLGLMAAGATLLLVVSYWPLPWYPGLRIELAFIYKLGFVAAVNACMTFLALYTYRLSKESRQMSAALSAAEVVMAREQKLHALDGLAAAAAHELGTPLSTIVLVTKEMARGLEPASPIAEDVALLEGQALRCREILQKLTRHPATQQDPVYNSLSVRELIEEAATPHQGGAIALDIKAEPRPDASPQGSEEPVGERRPGLIYGLGNIIENAVDFAHTWVEITATWSGLDVTVTVADDGPGFSADVIDTLGEPYVTTRPAHVGRDAEAPSGLGLGFFIAKTLLERSGGVLSLSNRAEPLHGAVVKISWRRSTFEAGVTVPTRGFAPWRKGRAVAANTDTA